MGRNKEFAFVLYDKEFPIAVVDTLDDVAKFFEIERKTAKQYCQACNRETYGYKRYAVKVFFDEGEE